MLCHSTSLTCFPVFTGRNREALCVVQSCPTLCDLMDWGQPGSSVHEIIQARILEWVAIHFSRRSSRPRDQTHVSCIAGRFFNIWATVLCQKCQGRKVQVDSWSQYPFLECPQEHPHPVPPHRDSLLPALAPTLPCTQAWLHWPRRTPQPPAMPWLHWFQNNVWKEALWHHACF